MVWFSVEVLFESQTNNVLSNQSTRSDELKKNNIFLHEAPLNANLIEFNSALGRVIKGRHVLFTAFQYLLSNNLIELASDEASLKNNKCMLYNELYPTFQTCCDSFYIVTHKIPVNVQLINDEKVNLKKVCQKYLSETQFIELCKLMDQGEKLKDDVADSNTFVKSITCFGQKSLSHLDYQTNDDKSNTRKKDNSVMTLRKLFNTDNEKTKINIQVTVSNIETPFHIHLLACSASSSQNDSKQKKRKHRQFIPNEDQLLSTNDETGSFFSIKKKKVEKIGPRRLKIPDDLALKKEQLDYISESNRLKSRLKDDRLQKMILEVDAHPEREKVLDYFLETEPQFLTFCEELLFVMGRRDESDLRSVHQLAEQLANHHK
ncbi:hypothetical protein C9374_009662 [Naegleria lovaniensis]|uniref:Uncharacterized protein n=1 Tax=Naegleria lovaniensis TaxID=51637 RepID=A0AA88KX70_NAELO|nr:uncharacterized protein C9374_009662 [Naegleria lovaniensis]KAG2393085.1 hypothetical protein C9374_009662 [Naegleria lovaniensis]